MREGHGVVLMLLHFYEERRGGMRVTRNSAETIRRRSTPPKKTMHQLMGALSSTCPAETPTIMRGQRHVRGRRETDADAGGSDPPGEQKEVSKRIQRWRSLATSGWSSLATCTEAVSESLAQRERPRPLCTRVQIEGVRAHRPVTCEGRVTLAIRQRYLWGGRSSIPMFLTEHQRVSRRCSGWGSNVSPMPGP